MRQYQRLTIIVAVVLGAIPSLAWELHYLLSYEALRGIKGISEEAMIEAGTLDDFVKTERVGLKRVLKEFEQQAARSMNYAPLPEALFFNDEEEKGLSLAQQFLMILRVNPSIGFPLFVLKAPHASQEGQSFTAEEIKKNSLLASVAAIDQGRALKKVMPGQKLSALEIIATASEEPDHGMDFNLWADNLSWFGAIYGFGAQPFGNPQLSYSSQAPFHMGFYFEPRIIYYAAPFLKKCYPEYRIGQFLALSRFAFASGHPYWGYRFLGIADHYLQDLTQPFHASLAPGVSAFKLIGMNILALMGISQPKTDQTQLLTNRHLGLENYQLGSIKNAILHRKDSPLLSALKDQSHDKKYETFSPPYARLVVAKEAYERSVKVDELITRALPKRLSDPSFLFDGALPGVNLYSEAHADSKEATEQLNEAFLEMMRSFGSHTRQSLSYVLTQGLGK